MYDKYFSLKICTLIRMFALTTMKQNVEDSILENPHLILWFTEITPLTEYALNLTIQKVFSQKSN